MLLLTYIKQLFYVKKYMDTDNSEVGTGVGTEVNGGKMGICNTLNNTYKILKKEIQLYSSIYDHFYFHLFLIPHKIFLFKYYPGYLSSTISDTIENVLLFLTRACAYAMFSFNSLKTNGLLKNGISIYW